MGPCLELVESNILKSCFEYFPFFFSLSQEDVLVREKRTASRACWG